MAVQAQSSTKDNLLRNALRGNSIFSLSSGLLFTFASETIASFLGIDDTEMLGLFGGDTFILIIGIGLLIYAAFLFYVSNLTNTQKLKQIGWLAIGADAAWVLGSIVLLVTDALDLTSGGSWAVLIIGDIVLTFAVVQYLGVRRLEQP